MKQGYTKKVLEAQILVYKKAINKTDDDLRDWLEYDFGKPINCPVCNYRWAKGARCAAGLYYKTSCPAKIDNMACYYQDWYDKLRGLGVFFQPNQVRQILKTRLKYWQCIYKEKYPENK